MSEVRWMVDGHQEWLDREARYPFLKEKLRVIERTYTTKSEFQIDHDEEDPSIRTLFEAERARFLASREKATAVRS